MKKITLLILLFTIQNNFAQNIFPATGNAGIGTISPETKLHINNGNNSYGAILATASESTFTLFTKTLTSLPVFTETFRFGLKYGSDENNGFISFYRGDASSGGFLGFSTNGMERIRIEKNGNVGVGITNANAKIEVVGDDPVNLEVAGFYNARVYGDANDKSETRINIGKLQGATRQPMGAIGAFPASNTSSQYGNLALYTRENQAVIERVRINSNGNVGIGTTTPDSKLAVNGTIHSKEVKVDMNGWPDYVFKKAYDLPTLEEVEKHINEKGHLQNIPSEEQVLKNGVNLGEMNAKLLQKMEEMTLYIIEEHKTNQKLIKIIEEQNKRLEVLEKKE